MHRDAFSGRGSADDDPLGDGVLGGQVNAGLLAGIGEGQQQSITGGGPAEQHTRCTDRDHQGTRQWAAIQAPDLRKRATQIGGDRLGLFPRQGLQPDTRRGFGRLRGVHGHRRRRAAVAEDRHVLRDPVRGQGPRLREYLAGKVGGPIPIGGVPAGVAAHAMPVAMGRIKAATGQPPFQLQ